LRRFRVFGVAVIICCLLATVMAGPAMAWQKVPTYDQDKAGVPPGPPLPADQTCWLAAASNMLTAGGYVSGAGDPAGIYATLCNHFGMNALGQIDTALLWYIGQYAGQATNYSVVTRYILAQNLTPDFIASELRRCQYVGIEVFPTGGSFCDHALTTWGDELAFDRGSPPQQPATVDITDSDKDVGPGGVDTYNWTQVLIGGNNYWALQNYYAPGVNGALSAVVTLCPVPEPSSLVALLLGASGIAVAFRRRR